MRTGSASGRACWRSPESRPAQSSSADRGSDGTQSNQDDELPADGVGLRREASCGVGGGRGRRRGGRRRLNGDTKVPLTCRGGKDGKLLVPIVHKQPAEDTRIWVSHARITRASEHEDAIFEYLNYGLVIAVRVEGGV
jgi:hypothetical protein